MTNEAKAAAMLATHDIAQLRMTGMILHVLVERGTLEAKHAAAIVRDAMTILPEDAAEMRQAYSQLAAGFQ